MHPVFLIGTTSTILQYLLLSRLIPRVSATPSERIALYLALSLTPVSLLSLYHGSVSQWLCLLTSLSFGLLLWLGRDPTNNPPNTSSLTDAEHWRSKLRDPSNLPDGSNVGHHVPSPAFPYNSLEEGQIRLLKFTGSAESERGILQFELQHSKLSQRPQYVALSYSWGQGNEGRKVIIHVNGQQFDISANLADALLKLNESGVSSIWVDAICINQADSTEKSREVTRMFAIYRTAQQVVIWLGQNTGPEKAMRELVLAAEDLERPVSRQRNAFDSHLKVHALEQLLLQPYWGRVWILQEVSAAKQASIYWGNYIFDLRSLETLLRDRDAVTADSQNSQGMAQRVMSVRAACRAQQKPRLMDILAMTASSHTSVLRDKVYGLLGLASDWTDFVQEPNYSEEVSENQLCLEMTANHIMWYSSADIIFLRSTSVHQARLPSWCPDYFHFQPRAFDKNLIPYVCGKDVNLGWERRRAFGQGSPNMNEVIPDTFIVDGPKLTLKGRCIGRISNLGSLLDEQCTPAELDEHHRPLDDIADRDIGKAFRRLLLICHEQTFGLQRSSAFFSLLYALPDYIFEDKGHTRVRRWLDLHKTFLEAFGVTITPSSDEYAFIARRGGGLSPSTKLLPEWREFFTLNEDNTISRRSKHPLHSMLQSISLILDERMRLMYIHDQVLLGWAHRDAQADDEVWHLEGCTLQAILRISGEMSEEHGQTVYKLVGHAYVDPVMASGIWMASEKRSRLVHLG